MNHATLIAQGHLEMTSGTTEPQIRLVHITRGIVLIIVGAGILVAASAWLGSGHAAAQIVQTESAAKSLDAALAATNPAILAANLASARGPTPSGPVVIDDASYDALVQAVERHHPLDRPGGTTAGTLTDSWGTRLRVRTRRDPIGAVVVDEIRSAGPDRRFDTSDDIGAHD
jgi:hypothetical protein